MKRLILAAAAIMMALPCLSQNAPAEPTGTYLFCQRDTCDLYLDVYEPSTDNVKPQTILYLFGGGFKEGERNGWLQRAWFSQMNEAGYRVVAIDYRLGMKGANGSKGLIQFANTLIDAIQLAVDDLFAATLFIIENRNELNIDPSSIVLAGTSAGAITSLQAEWEICNGHEPASVLPAGFNYAGVMAFSGSIFSRVGEISYRIEPCPHFMCHGTADGIVPAGKRSFMKIQNKGTFALTEDFKKNGYNFQTWRFEGNSHEISISMRAMLEEEFSFLENNVGKGLRRTIDATIKDPSIAVPDWARTDYKALY